MVMLFLRDYTYKYVQIIRAVSFIRPQENFFGMSYAQLCADWMRWIVSPDPDSSMNRGNITFLRGIDFGSQDRKTYGYYIKIDADKIVIPRGQAVFWPVIMYYADKYHHPDLDTAGLRQLVTTWMENGDWPPQPYQCTINGNPIVADFRNQQVYSDSFELTVQAAPYNTYTLANLLDEKWDPGISGTWECIVAGFFVLLDTKDLESGTYTLHSNGNGEFEYHTETLVEIEIQEADQMASTDTRTSAQKAKARRQAEQLKSIVEAKLTGDKLKLTRDESHLKNKFQSLARLIDYSHGLSQ